MNLNKSAQQPRAHTHEGAVAAVISPKEQLRRSVMACLLFEDSFYEDGESIASRIEELVKKVKNEDVLEIIQEAKFKMYLRHAPLFLADALIRKDPNFRKEVRPVLTKLLNRPDALMTYLSIYWRDGKKPIPASVKKAFRDALNKFDEYQLAKWKQDDKVIKLRDIIKLVHPTGNVELFDKVCKGTLATPDTWEVAISSISKQDPDYATKVKGIWLRLLSEKRLGALALLRNIRNMLEAKVSKADIINALDGTKFTKVFPYRFIAAARENPVFEAELEQKFYDAFKSSPKLEGKTAVLVDISGSMFSPMSGRSNMTSADAAFSLAAIAREICTDVVIYSFSNHTKLIPNRRGFALMDAIRGSQMHGGTEMFGSIVDVLNKNPELDRLVVITDEQSTYNEQADAYDAVRKRKLPVYVLNVDTYQNGVGYRDTWVNISGFTEKVFDYITAREGLVNEESVAEDNEG